MWDTHVKDGGEVWIPSEITGSHSSFEQVNDSLISLLQVVGCKGVTGSRIASRSILQPSEWSG